MTVTQAMLTPAHFAPPTAELRHVTPEMAATWLAGNSRNRRIRKDLVRAYARDMAEGNWTLNGEAIQISVTGVLLNGQHRLNAVVAAGVTIPLVVVTNLADEAQATIDTGAKRNLGDALKLEGYPDSNVLAAVATLELQMRKGGQYTTTNTEKRAVIDSNPDLRWVVASVLPTLPRRLATRTILAYTYWQMHKVDPDAAATFYSKLDTLANLPEGSPIAALHKRLAQSDRRSASWANRTATIVAIYNGWNAWRRGESRSMIKAATNADGTYTIPTLV